MGVIGPKGDASNGISSGEDRPEIISCGGRFGRCGDGCESVSRSTMECQQEKRESLSAVHKRRLQRPQFNSRTAPRWTGLRLPQPHRSDD